MHPGILWPVVGIALLLAVVGLILSLLDRTADTLLLGLSAATETAVVLQSLVAGIGLATGHAVHSTGTFVGYLIAIVLVMPFALAWAWTDRNRWSASVVSIGGVTVAVMTARLVMMWDGRA